MGMRTQGRKRKKIKIFYGIIASAVILPGLPKPLSGDLGKGWTAPVSLFDENAKD
jgi:hypothetical protein